MCFDRYHSLYHSFVYFSYFSYSSATLFFSHSMSHDSSAATFIDLTVVSSILNEDSEGRSDSFRVTLVGVGGGNSSLMNDGSEHEWSHNAPMAAQKGAKVKIVQLRAASAEEGEEWAKSMNDWRDYFLMDYANRQAI